MSYFVAQSHNPQSSDPNLSTGESTDAAMHLRLYIAGGSPNSVNALANLTLICECTSGLPIQVEVIDIWREPLRALNDGILLTPTLRRLSPLPEVNIIGDLNDLQAVINLLGIETYAAKRPDGILDVIPDAFLNDFPANLEGNLL